MKSVMPVKSMNSVKPASLIKNVSRQFLVAFLALSLVFLTVPLSGCSSSQFEQVLNEVGPAVGTILQIVALFRGSPANQSIGTKVDADVAALEQIYSDFETASAANKGSIEGQINAAFATLNADLNTVFGVAQVSDKNTQAKLAALVALVTTAVQIAEASIPAASPELTSNTGPSIPQLNASDLVSSWNKILVAKTGNGAVDSWTSKHKLHIHRKFVRLASLGMAN